MLNEQSSVLPQIGDLLPKHLALVLQALLFGGAVGALSPSGAARQLCAQEFSNAGEHSAGQQNHLVKHMEAANLMPGSWKHLCKCRRIDVRPIGRNPHDHQRIRLELDQKLAGRLHGRAALGDPVGNTLTGLGVHCVEDRVGAIVHLVDDEVSGEALANPGRVGATELAFPPPLRPSTRRAWRWARGR